MAMKFYLWLKGVKGDSSDPDHQGEIGLSGVTWNGRYIGADGLGRSKAHIDDLVVTKDTDNISPLLQLASTSGQTFEEGIVTVEVVTEKGLRLRSVFLRLRDVLIDSFVESGDGESIRLDFASLEIVQL